MANRLAYDIVVNDDGTLKLRQFGEEVEHAGTELEDTGKKADESGKKIDAAGKKAESSGSRFGGFSTVVSRAAASAVAMSSAVLSTIGPITSITAATVHFAVAAGPAVAVLPALAAGAGLVALTVKAAGPAMLAAITPVTGAWTKQETVVGRLAADGVPKLARSFVTANFPAIRAATDSIAVSINGVVRQVAAWANSSVGRGVISKVTKDVATQFQIMAPYVTAVALSFGNLIGRAADPAFTGLGDEVAKITTKVNHFIDGISRQDIANGLKTARDAAGALGGKLSLVVAAVQWMGTHVALVKAFSDALAIAGIALGALSGNWLAVAVGLFSLLANHWQQLTGVFRQATGATGPLAGALGRLQAIGALVSGWVQGQLIPALQRAAQTVMPGVREAVDQVHKAFSGMGPTIQNVRQIFAFIGTLLTTVVIPIFAHWARVELPLLAVGFRGVVLVIKATIQAIHDALNAFLTFTSLTLGALQGLFTVMGKIPGRVGKPFRDAAAAIGAAKDKVDGLKAALNSVPKSTKVTLTVTELHRAVNVPNGPGGRPDSDRFQGRPAPKHAASGGPFLARQRITVGEHGRETVEFGSSGFVTPGTSSGAGPRGGDIHVHISNAVVGGNPQIARTVVTAVREAVQRGQIVLPRSGGFV